uniref:Uncharacterized protein n=1 Tax=viral metagenome TaxID=1070528 RepID=A0A6M3JGV3_9ZZZZ
MKPKNKILLKVGDAEIGATLVYVPERKSVWIKIWCPPRSFISRDYSIKSILKKLANQEGE